MNRRQPADNREGREDGVEGKRVRVELLGHGGTDEVTEGEGGVLSVEVFDGYGVTVHSEVPGGRTRRTTYPWHAILRVEETVDPDEEADAPVPDAEEDGGR